MRELAYVRRAPSASCVGAQATRSFSSNICCASMIRLASAIRSAMRPNLVLPGLFLGMRSLPVVRPYRTRFLCLGLGSAFRTRKYLRIKFPLRLASGAPQLRHFTSRSTVSGPARRRRRGIARCRSGNGTRMASPQPLYAPYTSYWEVRCIPI